MGWIRHHAIIVTGSYEDWIERAHQKALEIFPWVSPICPSQVNGTQAFFVPPDGSKEGWNESNEGDIQRRSFIEWLDKQRYEDGSSPLGWIEIFFRDDNQDAKIVAHSEEWKRFHEADKEGWTKKVRW